jgi:hypothetical protein
LARKASTSCVIGGGTSMLAPANIGSINAADAATVSSLSSSWPYSGQTMP